MRQNVLVPETDAPEVLPAGGTAVAERPLEESLSDVPWVTIVWDDPVNLMSYVAHVFVTYFHYPKSKAERLMLADTPLIPLYFHVSRHLVKPHVRGWRDNIMNTHYSKHLSLQ